MSDPSTSAHHSAQLRLVLDCGSYGIIPLSQASENFVIAKSPVAVPPCNATIVLTTDGSTYRRPVYLVNGFTSGSREAAIFLPDQAATA